jgi:hypothetical protein
MSQSSYKYLGQFESHLKVFLAINGTANIKKCGNLLLAGAQGWHHSPGLALSVDSAVALTPIVDCIAKKSSEATSKDENAKLRRQMTYNKQNKSY